MSKRIIKAPKEPIIAKKADTPHEQAPLVRTLERYPCEDLSTDSLCSAFSFKHSIDYGANLRDQFASVAGGILDELSKLNYWPRLRAWKSSPWAETQFFTPIPERVC